MLGLYVHVPFCAAICNYCNFNRGLFDAGLKARYVDALLREIAHADAARAAGFDNVSLDLMMWLPQQSVSDWLESVDRAIHVSPDHLSLYLLELYPNAPLRDEMARGRWSQAPDDDAATMYLTAMERLDEAGYEQYEISNVSRPGRRS